MAGVEIRPIPVQETYPLRALVLRPHLDGDVMPFEGDEMDGATHFGAFAHDRLIGIGSAMPVPHDGVPAVQIRAMAVHPDHRGSGAGTALVARLLEHAAARGVDLVWCNARVAAESLYRRAGFVRVSEPWDSEPLGAHVRMVRRIESA